MARRRHKAAKVRTASAKAESFALPAVKAQVWSGTFGDFRNSSANDGPSLAWARYNAPLTYGFAAAATPYISERNRSAAADVTEDLAERVPTMAAIINEAISSGIGTGLTLSSKPKAARLGISDDQANKLAHDIEQAWVEYCNEPRECDFTERHDLHSLVTALYVSYLTRGEAAGVMEWSRASLGRYFTKLRALDARQIDVTKTMQSATSRTFNGVTFDSAGRWIGCYVVPYALGSQIIRQQAVFVPAYTPHGRPKMIHVWSLRYANQVRGKTPLIGALTPVKARETAGEFVLDGFLVQNQTAATVTSDLPPAAALSKLEGDAFMGGAPGVAGTATANAFAAEWASTRANFYKDTKIGFGPGKVTALAPGDKLDIVKSETPHAQYLNFDRSLTRQAARAAGESFSVVSGDFSETSYSASRLEAIPPYRVAIRRRREIIGRIYQMVFECWLEEVIERQLIDNPSRVPFFMDKSAYACAKWRGVGPIVGDRYKEAKADELELNLGLNTLEGALGDRGLDLEDVLDQRAYEKRALAERGLPYPFDNPIAGNGANDPLLNDEPANDGRATQ